MKELKLLDILKIANIPEIESNKDFIVKHVINYSKKEINNYTLLFHLDEDRIRGRYWSQNHSVVIITERPELCTDLGDEIYVIKTDQLKEKYWRFVNYYRNLFKLPVIGVTGTCGKSTTKEMIRQILDPDLHVVSTWMSMNSMSVNLRYLTRIDDETDVAVFEMPVAYPGYLRVACQYFQPQIRILLNIDVHHLADCETPEEYMKAKAEITEGMDPEKGILILNADDQNIKKVIDITPYKKVIFFGKNNIANYRAKNIRYVSGGMNFLLENEGKNYSVFVPGYGEHNVYNALAAIVAVVNVGIDIDTAIMRLASFEHLEEHLEFKHGMRGCTVIDDTWNSAPLSMTSALQVLRNIGKGKKKIALLGYMPQLGDGPYANKIYEEMGETTYKAGVDLLIVVGEEARLIKEGALKAGMDPNKVSLCYTGNEVFEYIADQVNEESIILLKVTHRVMKQPSFEKLKRKLILEILQTDEEGLV